MEIVRYRTDEGVFTALLVSEGRKFAKVIIMDSQSIRIRKVSKGEVRWMDKLDYPLNLAVYRFRQAYFKFNPGTASQELAGLLGIEEGEWDKRCYQCDRKVAYLFPDSRCALCTRTTPEQA